MQNDVIYVIGFFLSLIVLMIFLKQIKHGKKRSHPYYFLRDDFLSPAELSFYLTLRNAVSNWAIVFPKIRLGDLFYVGYKNKSLFWEYTNKITSKHVDFLLCNPKTVKPLIGVELDDKSHQKSDRKKRDEFVNTVFAAGNLPLARIPVKNTYSTSELNSKLLQYINPIKGNSPEKENGENNENSEPICSNCGSKMVIRIAKKGSNKGKRFWGCPNYPQCRSIIKID